VRVHQVWGERETEALGSIESSPAGSPRGDRAYEGRAYEGRSQSDGRCYNRMIDTAGRPLFEGGRLRGIERKLQVMRVLAAGAVRSGYPAAVGDNLAAAEPKRSPPVR
jgi:hypothetical protein